ncbi:ribose-phosphate diphosphokinase [methanotrophic endosymbiont of Bathymodiolus puteoserpentis (Logatchev)]|jgi:ribose-phosphate pyrophosphokinase|uniref:ribose-phosphate diphosphokinase n=1 Tax=methanotrophic endosymbiont of Bathymodiolus puteoserpentis (Logatchev) TaxID=343235 RepID=UPI0013C9A984|nr:ribose-phosphate diphosphokinase [methanotrophic endosymbiont of Bathymodiolus puteoserpentis (Logatchev)]SHE20872.1 Ribose-phosphate pyrophosphokinase [methanotrophic endosymbiont of Bathymodiolus puteoserpentis (Logatchev)]
MLMLIFPDYQLQAERLAARLAIPTENVHIHHFPDGESLVRLPPSLPEHVLICRSLNQPNDKLIELLFCARTARQLGAKRLTLIAPYLSYMRQDIANQPGEAVSQRIMGQMLAELFDDVITVDPHLHRINSLDQAIPIKNAISLTAANEVAKFLQKKLDYALLLGPDSESEQWVSAIANKIGFDFAVATKIRRGDKQVEVSLPDFDFSNQPVVIIDDMASTGRTLSKATELLLEAGAQKIDAVITHPLFCGDAEAHILQAGVKNIWSTDSISHSTACIYLDNLLAGAVWDIL